MSSSSQVLPRSDVALPPGPPAPKGKVLFLIDSLLGMGGAEGALSKIVTHLPRYGFNCTIATFRLAQDPQFLRSFPCPVHDFTIDRIYDFRALSAVLKLRKLVAREQFDIIHTMFPTSDLWGGPIARMGTRALLVSGRRDLGIVRGKKHELAYRWLGGQFNQVQAVSEAAREACITRDGLSPDRVFTVPNGVEFENILAEPPERDLAQRFGLNRDGATVIAAAGKIWPVKGIDILIRAAAIVCREFPSTNFLIAGSKETPYGVGIQTLIDALDLGANVKLVGRLSPVVPVMKAADIFCLLSRSEGMSNALLEGMACGLPCVASAVGGNVEVVEEGRTGLLVPPEDPEAAAKGLLRLLRNPMLRTEMGQNGRTRVAEHFTVDGMVQKMGKLYSQLLDSRAAPAN